jgi:hypothetical protein
MVHSLPLHYISYSPPTSLFLSLSLFSSVCLSATYLPTIYPFSVPIECQEGRRERKRKEEGTTPHDRSAKLKARP